MARRQQKKSGEKQRLEIPLPAGVARRDDHPQRNTPETVVLVAALLMLAALGYAVQPILSPFVLLGGLVYLLYPLRVDPVVRRMMWLGVFLFVLWFFYSVLHLLAPFLIAFLIAYILNPAVTRLGERGFPRWASSLIAVALLIGVVVAVMLFVVPLAIQQFNGIIARATGIARDFSVFLQSGKIFDFLAAYGVPVEKAREMINEQITPRLQNLLTGLFEGVFGFLSGVSSLALQLINVIIIPFLVFYLLMDFPVIMHRFLMFVPGDRRPRTGELARMVDGLMGRYFRGAITVAFLQGSISALGLWAIGVEYALVLGIMTGILNFIPYVGLLTSLVVSSIVALFSGDPVLVKVIGVVILFLSQKLLEATVLGPKIIGGQVGLHPVLLILCLLVFGFFLGFVGLLIAVPVTALIIAAVKEWETGRKARLAGEP
jgi:predicted PurR-regulated permease PerM